MKDLTGAPGVNLCLHVWQATLRWDLYETLYIRYIGGRFVPVLDMREEDDDPSNDIEITEENFPTLLQTMEDLTALKNSQDMDQSISAELALAELFRVRVHGYTGVEGKYWTDRTPELLPLFEAERR